MSVRVLFATVAILAVSAPAGAQIAPFDMSPEITQRRTPAPMPQAPAPAPVVVEEEPAAPIVAPAPPPAAQEPAPIPTPVPEQPSEPTPEAVPETVDAPPVDAVTAEPDAVEPAETVEPLALDRFILPGDGIRLEGEASTRAFDLYLTEAQAAAPATLDLGLLNAILVAPESSNLGVSINGTNVLSTPIGFASEPTPLQADVPEGILVAGANRIVFDASQRHRTDCSVGSTYELWTDIYGPQTRLRFADPALDQISMISDLPAIGMAQDGASHIRLMIPDMASPEASSAALGLVQSLALAMRAASVDIELIEALGEDTSSGTITAILATAGELPEAAQGLADRAASGPLVAVLPESDAPNTILVSGPDWASIGVAIASLHGEGATDNLGAMRVDIPSSIPMVEGRQTIPLDDLGVDTVQFNGRRYTTDMRFALPWDFYAEMYSEAELILDAAYSAAVLPGSQLDVYVNGQIAAVFPVLRTDGGTFRNSRLRIPMTNFRPGINQLHVEIILLTREDELCLPGSVGRAQDRFLFSSGSRLAFPDFGRMARLPDLGKFAGAGAPYADDAVVDIVVGSDDASMRSAMLIAANMALSSGRTVQFARVAPEALDPTRPAVVVAPMDQLDAAMLARGRIVDPASIDFAASGDVDSALDEWRRSASGSSENIWDRLQSWVADRFDLRPENFWLLRRADGAYVPQAPEAAILSQAMQPEGGLWTFLTIPDADGFEAAVDRLVTPEIWQSIDGRVTAIGPNDAEPLILQPRQVHMIATQPWSLTNLRLVAANWLSTNVLAYALALGGIAVLLTLATSLLLTDRGGRK